MRNEATKARVIDHVENARAMGAHVEQFGPDHGLFHPATVLTGVTPEMRIAQEETFGPVAPIIKFSTTEEAIAIANSSKLGLIASLWTRDLASAWRVGEALQHGSVNINETSNYWDQLAPFGGTGQSGVGGELSQWFLQTFTESKVRCSTSETATSATTAEPKAAGEKLGVGPVVSRIDGPPPPYSWGATVPGHL